MTAGLSYKAFTVQDSRCHLLQIDLRQRELRPVIDKDSFPFNTGHAQTKAVEEGAVACGPGGYNIVLYHGLGIQDQPQHALVVDEEIWTTGLAGGGFGVLIGDGFVRCQKNRIQVHVWKPDGGSFEVEHVNRGHEGEVVAFTRRGGTNEFPKFKGKHFYSLTAPASGDGPLRVTKVQDIPPKVWPGQTVLEATYDLGLVIDDDVKWKQNLGAEGVKHVISGIPQVVAEGKNIVGTYDLDPTASNGPDNWWVRRNPRTAIGCSEDGTTAYMLFVEGRLPNPYRPDAEESRGVRLMALGTICERQGMWGAVDMDGGGSAFQWSAPGGMDPGCYNAAGTIAGQRPAQFSAAVF